MSFLKTETKIVPVLGQTVFFGPESLGFTVIKNPSGYYPYTLSLGQTPTSCKAQVAGAETIIALGQALVELGTHLRG